MHFFVLPESADIYQLLKYKNENIESVVLKCDIPYSLLKDNFGVGMYRWYDHKARSPFLEVRLNKKDFSKDMILETSSSVKEEWKNKAIYYRYINKIIDYRIVNKDRPVEVTINNDKIEVELNEEFNFLNYFPLKQLKQENLENDYTEDIVVQEKQDEVKIKKISKSLLDKIKSLINKKVTR